MSELAMESNSTVSRIMEGDETVSAAELEALIPAYNMAEKALKIVKDYIRARVEGGEELQGATMEPGSVTRKIVDVRAAAASMKQELGEDFDTAAWVKMLSVSVTDLDKFWCQAHGVKPATKEGRTLVGQLDRVMGKAMTSTQTKDKFTLKK